MKPLFITLFLLISTALSAQEHLAIADLPIDGPLDRFVNELTIRGVVPQRNIDDNIVMLQTDVNGQPIDYIVAASEDTQHVYRVVVMTQPKMSWRWVRNEYLHYKNELSKAYGQPTKYVETFMAPYTTRKKLRRHQIQAFAEGKAQWATFFTVSNDDGEEIGTVAVQIAPSGSLAKVVIIYDDTKNSERYAPNSEEE